jgi:hypothetical protein
MRLMEKAHFHYRKGEEVPPALDATAAVLRAADCYIAVTPEFNHTIAPGLTNTMNYFGGSVYANKPSGIATYSAGAVRAYQPSVGLLVPIGESSRSAAVVARLWFDHAVDVAVGRGALWGCSACVPERTRMPAGIRHVPARTGMA